MTEPRAGQAGKRRHPAKRGRIVTAGLSAGAAVLLVGAMGTSGSATPASPASTGGPPVVLRIAPGTSGSSARAAPQIAPSYAPPDTSSQAS